MLLAEEVTDRAAVVAVLHDTRRTAMNAELVLDAHAREVVALAERAVVVDEELRDDEEADALRAGRRTRGPGEHQVHDVVGDIMLTPGDEDLLTEDAPGAVVGRLGLGGECANVGARVGLGEVHRAGPFTADELLEVDLLLALVAVMHDRLDGTPAEQRAQRERHVGRRGHLLDGCGEQLREPTAAVGLREPDAVPAGLDELAVGLSETGGGGDAAVLVELGADRVAVAVGRGDHLVEETARLSYETVDEIRIGVLVPLELGEGVEIGHVPKGERDVLDGAPEVAHGGKG